ncbi:MAG: UDP-glucose--hexose-1-phosphate uridylyltransferase [Pacificimonas sp.]
MDETAQPHRRYDPLAGRWVLVSPHRLERPWQGAAETTADIRPSHDPDCYLCPGNTRANGAKNPDYEGVWLFDNDFPALLLDNEGGATADPLFRSEPARGSARVLCFSPNHAKTLPDLTDAERRAVVEAWCAETSRLGETHAHVQIFENKGAAMGCSNPHPHGQIWATGHVPDLVRDEDRTQAAWLDEHGMPMLRQLIEREAGGDRVVVETDEWLAIVPYWASWPYELLIVPKRPAARLPDLDSTARDDLAVFLGRLLAACDRLFGVSFPYSMGLHGAPFGQGGTAHWQVHAHVYPPLLRSASVRKFMVGYEMLAKPQRDLTAEAAAARLRALVE